MKNKFFNPVFLQNGEKSVLGECNKKIIRPALLTAFLLLIPLLGNLFVEGWDWRWHSFVLAGIVLFGTGFAYELIAGRSEKIAYKTAFGIGLGTALLLFWVNGAVGVIGSENNPANLLFGLVFLAGFIGSLFSRFKARGMSYTMSLAAIIQFLIPLFALIVWPAQASWGEAGVVGVLVFNSIFSLLFSFSALLFQRASFSKSE